MPVSQRVSTLVAAWLLCLNVRLVLGGWERTCSAETMREPPRGHFCGRQLAGIVSTVCRMQGGYYSGSSSSYFFNKRSTDTDTMNGKYEPKEKNASVTLTVKFNYQKGADC